MTFRSNSLSSNNSLTYNLVNGFLMLDSPGNGDTVLKYALVSSRSSLPRLDQGCYPEMRLFFRLTRHKKQLFSVRPFRNRGNRLSLAKR